jgi:hypothetical protein
MGRAEVLQGVRQMRFEALLDRRERGELNQEEAGEMLAIFHGPHHLAEYGPDGSPRDDAKLAA